MRERSLSASMTGVRSRMAAVAASSTIPVLFAAIAAAGGGPLPAWFALSSLALVGLGLHATRRRRECAGCDGDPSCARERVRAFGAAAYGWAAGLVAALLAVAAMAR